MIICLKHKIDYHHGECPSCKSVREGVSLNYSSSNPEHTSKYILNKVKELNKLTDKLKEINSKIQKLLKENK